VPLPHGRPLRVLISSAPQDQQLKEQVVRHLQVLVHVAGVEVWTPEHVRAGDDWRQEGDAALDRADVVLLLISPDFLASEFLHDVEIPKLFSKRAQGGLKVIPVLIRSCLWQAHPWLSALKPLPASGKPIASFQGDSRDQALTEVVAEIVEFAGSIPARVAALRVPAPVKVQKLEQSNDDVHLSDSHNERIVALTEGSPSRRQKDILTQFLYELSLRRAVNVETLSRLSGTDYQQGTESPAACIKSLDEFRATIIRYAVQLHDYPRGRVALESILGVTRHFLDTWSGRSIPELPFTDENMTRFEFFGDLGGLRSKIGTIVISISEIVGVPQPWRHV